MLDWFESEWGGKNVLNVKKIMLQPCGFLDVFVVLSCRSTAAVAVVPWKW